MLSRSFVPTLLGGWKSDVEKVRTGVLGRMIRLLIVEGRFNDDFDFGFLQGLGLV